MNTTASLDQETLEATRQFLVRLPHEYDLVEAVVFGSRARNAHATDSDADLAIVLRGEHGKRFDVVRSLSEVAFDVMLETGILIQPVPLWEEEWKSPEQFDNPALVRNIQREGIRV
jgi:predicted nucleotidyltransferase